MMKWYIICIRAYLVFKEKWGRWEKKEREGPRGDTGASGALGPAGERVSAITLLWMTNMQVFVFNVIIAGCFLYMFVQYNNI